MPLPIPTYIPPIGPQTDPTKVNVAVVVGGQLASAPARGIGLTAEELTLIETGISDGGTIQPATAQTRNRIVNGAMQVSQENGSTVSASGANNAGYYPADQWLGQWTTTGANMNLRQDPIAAWTPLSPNNSGVCMFYNGTAGTMPAGGYMFFSQRIEGKRVADFGWGTATARQVIVRFWVSAPAGTYSLSIRNAAYDRSYIAAFTIASSLVWQAVTLVVPGDTTGTWPISTSFGMEIGISFAIGTTGAGNAGWQAGNKSGLTGQTNGAGLTGIFSIADFGLYLDPLATGIAPPWQMPNEAEELRACQRYYVANPNQGTMLGYYYGAAGTALMGAGTLFNPVPMRTIPTTVVLTAPTLTNCSAFALSFNDLYGTTYRVTVTAAGIYRAWGGVYAQNARM